MADPYDMAPENEFKPPKDEENLIAWLEKRIECGKPRVSEIQMKLNLAFVLGQQWLVWDSAKRAFRRPVTARNDPNAPVRVTVNKIGGIVERTTSRLTKSVPVPECRPVGDSDDDVDTAKVGTRILAHEMDRIAWDSLLADFYLSWVTPLGWSYLYIYWDPEAGADVANTAEGEIFQGEVCVEVAPAFELAVDPNAQTMKEARWAVRTLSMTKEAVWEMYGKVPAGAETGRTIADEVNDLIEASHQQTGREDFVKVHQFWLRPGGRAEPEGLVVTWCGKTVLESMPYPYEHGRLPFVQFNLLPGMGMREGRTWVNDLIPLQTDYNDARSREAMIRRTLTPKFVAPIGSIDQNRMTSRVEVLTYAPIGSAPQLVMPDGRWMAQFETAMNRTDTEMGERAGQADVSSGQAPSSMPAAAILALQEADDTKLAITAKLLAQGVEEVGWHVLNLVKEFWVEDRVVRTWSEDSTLKVDHFNDADLANGFDVHVSSESALPRSKAARTQLAIDLWTQGVIQDPQQYVRMLDMPGTEFIADQLSLDSKEAERENELLRNGEFVEVAQWQNHMAHYDTHNAFRKTADYHRMSPEGRALFDGHAETHVPFFAGPNAGAAPDPSLAGAAPGGPMGVGDGVDPTTGGAVDPLAAATGQAPGADENTKVRNAAGIGGAGEQGAVPGHSADTQAARTGN